MCEMVAEEVARYEYIYTFACFCGAWKGSAHPRSRRARNSLNGFLVGRACFLLCCVVLCCVVLCCVVLCCVVCK
jgi:hypothetical protein